MQKPMPPNRTASRARRKFSSPCGLTDRFRLTGWIAVVPLALVVPVAALPAVPIGDWLLVAWPCWLYTLWTIAAAAAAAAAESLPPWGDVGVEMLDEL